MAENALTREALASKVAEIRALADEAESRSRRTAHLIGAIDDLADDLADLSDQSDRGQQLRTEALDRIMAFCSLAKEATESVADCSGKIGFAVHAIERGGAHR